jgi:SM-20-related protein
MTMLAFDQPPWLADAFLACTCQGKALPMSTALVTQLTLDQLASHGWSQQSNFLSAELTLALARECRQHAEDGRLVPAGIGRAAGHAVQPSVRGDHVRWLETGQSDACDSYLAIMETLRLALNRDFFLGLDNFETHFAAYAPGACYHKHIDRFRDDDLRTISVVVYLNAGWDVLEGGALRLHPDGLPQLDISPEGSRLVLFVAADMAHEVLPATRERISLAGWFRRRDPVSSIQPSA